MCAPVLESHWIGTFELDGDKVVLKAQLQANSGPIDVTLRIPLDGPLMLALAGVSAQAPEVNVRLTMEAGSFVFQGRFEDQRPCGSVCFKVNPTFSKDVAALGLTPFSKQYLMLLAAKGVGQNDLKLFGMLQGLTLTDVIELTLCNVRAEMIQEFRQLGLWPLSASDMIQLHTHGIMPSDVASWQTLGYNDLSAQQLVQMALHEVTPDFAQALAELGLRDLSVEQLNKLRDHNVTPEFVREFKRAVGSERLSVEQLVKLKIHGIGPEVFKALETAV